MIRADFSDFPCESLSDPGLTATLDVAIHYIRKFSYGKTWIEGIDSNQTVRLRKDASSCSNLKFYTIGEGIELTLI